MRNCPLPKVGFGHVDHTAVLQLQGQIRHVAAGALRSFVDEVVAADEADTVVIDLSGVEFMDSTGMGLLARIGRHSLEDHGRRAVIVCPANDVATTLRSASFDKLFVMTERFPFEHPAHLDEVALGPPHGAAEEAAQGRVILEAHQDLSSLGEQNREAFKDVIAALEEDLKRRSAPSGDAGASAHP